MNKKFPGQDKYQMNFLSLAAGHDDKLTKQGDQLLSD